MASYQNEYSEKELKMFHDRIKRKEMLINNSLEKVGNIRNEKDRRILDE